jgi:outer membrane protein assembly factor BamD
MRILAIILCLITISCASGAKKAADVDDVTPPETLYADAQDAFNEGSYKTAAEGFLEVERQHPYSKLAVPAQINAAFAYYKDEKYKEAIAALERFIKLNPGSSDISYAYYLTALSYYNQITDVGRDQQMTLNAMAAFKNVVDKFPNTDYAKDARLKLDLVEDHLAGKEMTVGRYYLNRNEYIGAINRFKKVVDEYERSAQVEEALYRLVECYLSMGIRPEAEKYAAVLGYNYPGSEWYASAYKLMGN